MQMIFFASNEYKKQQLMDGGEHLFGPSTQFTKLAINWI